MPATFFARIPLSDAKDPTVALRGLGSQPRIICTILDGADSDGVHCVRIYHTGPEWASGVVAGQGFFADDPSDPRPWND